MTLLERWLELLMAERARRHGDDGDALQQMLQVLDEMGARLRSVPGFEPSAAEQTRWGQALDILLRQRSR